MLGTLIRLVGAVMILAVTALILQRVAAESGEVVLLRTIDSGKMAETRVWIVEEHGTTWLRAGRRQAGWYQMIMNNPVVEVERSGEVYEAHAFPIEGGEWVDHVNALMLRKYGWADQVIGLWVDRSESVAIRLDPR